MVDIDLTNDAKSMLENNGYEVGGYNPHHTSAWVIGNEYGRLGMVVADHEQDAFDVAADNGIINVQKMSREDYDEYQSNGWDDSYILAGNASEPFWSENLWITKILTA